ncbi:hypothetical protein FRB96_009660 [Tulasnella sp. 330]|nr:hypothetical protein FRB96_009660 [Tulasnella sp. 330]
MQKAKLKLGKGKKPANNATDTTFKARSIALPVQTIAANQDDAEPTTRRNLTLADLMIQVKHYSVNTKKDALIGMRELLEAHPELISPNLNAIIHSTARTIGDEQVLIPHAAPVVLHATSALSHIFREIRIDSIGFLDLLMEHSPQAFLRGQQRALDGYLSLLNLRGRSAGQSGGN